MPSFTTSLYSASAEDNAMDAFILLDQKMEPPPNINTYPKVDFRSMESLVQFESV